MYQIQKEMVIALIPARKGSKGIKEKNIKSLKGFPLITYSIAASILSKKIKRTIVTTDSETIAKMARYYGAEVPFLRPTEFAEDKSPDLDFVLHAIKWLQINEGILPEYFVHLRPTTPLRDVTIVDNAISAITNNQEATSLRSGHVASESPFKWFTKNEDGYFESIIKGLDNDKANGRRQDYPNVYIPNGYVDVIKTDFVLKNNILHGTNMLGFETPFCCEVDTLDDFSFLEYNMERISLPIYDYLKAQF